MPNYGAEPNRENSHHLDPGDARTAQFPTGNGQGDDVQVGSETGYRWLSFPWSWGRWIGTGAAVGLGVLTYVLYLRARLPAGPSSLLGFVYALAGTWCFLHALCLSFLKDRARSGGRLGQLYALLQGHFSYALLSLVLLVLHSFGRMDPHLSGTYALVALIALVASGYLGKGLDQLLPRLIARELNTELVGAAPLHTDTTRRIARHYTLLTRWRQVHRVLAILALGLIVWHLVFVLEMYLTGQLPVP